MIVKVILQVQYFTYSTYWLAETSGEGKRYKFFLNYIKSDFCFCFVLFVGRRNQERKRKKGAADGNQNKNLKNDTHTQKSFFRLKKIYMYVLIIIQKLFTKYCQYLILFPFHLSLSLDLTNDRILFSPIFSL